MESGRLQGIKGERTRPITQPHKIPVPGWIDAIATNRQMSVMKPLDVLGCKKRLDKEGRHVRATMMI